METWASFVSILKSVSVAAAPRTWRFEAASPAKILRAGSAHDMTLGMSPGSTAIKEWLKQGEGAEYLAARSAVEDRIDVNRGVIQQHHAAATLVDIPSGGQATRTAWADNDLEWRRALLGTVIERVVLNPAVKGRNRFDPDRVEITWRA